MSITITGPRHDSDWDTSFDEAFFVACSRRTRRPTDDR